MGDIADDVLEGIMCQVCGVIMCDAFDAPGYPQTCAGCAVDSDEEDEDGG